jgi:hypothetical protein
MKRLFGGNIREQEKGNVNMADTPHHQTPCRPQPHQRALPLKKIHFFFCYFKNLGYYICREAQKR